MSKKKAKIAITIDEELLKRARSVVTAGSSSSLSAYIEHAVAAQLAAETCFDELVVEVLERTGGRVTAKERAAARSLLRGAA